MWPLLGTGHDVCWGAGGAGEAHGPLRATGAALFRFGSLGSPWAAFGLVARDRGPAPRPRRHLLPGSLEQDAARPVAEGRSRLDGSTAKYLLLLDAHRHRQSVPPRLVLRHPLKLALAVALVGEMGGGEFLPGPLPRSGLDLVGPPCGRVDGESNLNRGLHGYWDRGGRGGRSGRVEGAAGWPRGHGRSLRGADVLAGGRFLLSPKGDAARHGYDHNLFRRREPRTFSFRE